MNSLISSWCLLSVVCLLIVVGASADAPDASSNTTQAGTCIGNSSLPCLSNKLVAAFRKIHNIPEIPITEWMSLVPSSAPEGRSQLLEKPVAESRFRRQGLLLTIGEAVDDFVASRSVRIALPDWATGSGHAVDLDMSRAFTQVTGRGKKKNMGMGMMAMMMMGKMMMMTMGMVKMKAMKALIIGTIALLLSKLQLFKMLMKKDEGESKHVIVLADHGSDHGGGGGGGGHGGGMHGGGSSVHIVQDSYGPPSGGGGGGGHGGGGGGGWSGGGGGGGGWSDSGSSGGDSWGGGGGGAGGGWSSGGSGGYGGGQSSGGYGGGQSSGGGGGYNYGGGGGTHNGGGGGGYGGGGGGGGWGKRAYHYDTYVNHPPTPNTTTE